MQDTYESAGRAKLTPERLRDIGLFGGMRGDTLQRLCEVLPVVEVASGERIVEEGDSARCLFVVLDGELEVVKRSQRGVEVRVAVLGPSDWFGEMSLLDVQPRSCSVVCVAPATLVRLSHRDVDELLYRADMKAYTLMMMNIARELSRRLRVADGILAQLQLTLAGEYSRGSGAR